MTTSPFLVGTSTERERATRIGVARIVVGSALLAPGLARRAFGVPASHDNQTVRMLARLAGIRNVILGMWTLVGRDHDVEQRRLCYQFNASVDAADLVAIAWALRQDRALRQTAVMSFALGGSACLAWIDLLRDLA